MAKIVTFLWFFLKKKFIVKIIIKIIKKGKSFKNKNLNI